MSHARVFGCHGDVVAGESAFSGAGVPLAQSRGHQLSRGVERLLRRQKQLVRLEQLVDIGLTASGVRKRVNRHALHRIHDGVFAAHPPPYSRHQRWLAATYSCGGPSFISDVTSVEALGLTEERWPAIHVTKPSGSTRGPRGITVHRRAVDPRDVIAAHGIPCTSAARTIVDCAAMLDAEALEDILMAADSRGILNRPRLDELTEAHRGCRGMRTLTSLVTDEPVDVRSVNERRMLRICRRAGVEQPLTNYRIDVGDRTFYADFCWPALGLIVEADSWRWHGGRQASESDADRDQLLSTAGWRLVHFTRDQIHGRAEETERRIVELTRAPRLTGGATLAR